MGNNLENHRRSYDKQELRRKDLEGHPMLQFQKWFMEMEAVANETGDSTAMAVSTIGADGFPKARIVLLKNYSVDGFTFYTNYQSEKGKAIAENPKVCLSFFWPSLERQIIVKGKAEKIPAKLSDKYFESRPVGSQFSATVSCQSEVAKNREELEKKLEKLQKKHKDGKIPRPKHWGGFLVKPVSMEFWQGRENRLHDRFRYSLEKDKWKVERLEP